MSLFSDFSFALIAQNLNASHALHPTSEWGQVTLRFVLNALALVVTVGLTALFLRLVPWTERWVLRRAVRRADGQSATATELDMQARVHTLTTVVGSLTRVVVFSIASIMVLGQLGVEIKPLLAGAGIAGVAVGFGAQSIVKDFFAGFFILLEDQFDVGDTVTIGTTTGVVERITLRITVLRDQNGTAYFIPNSAIALVANRTHDWSRVAVEFLMAPKVSIEKASELLDKVKARAQDHEQFAENHRESIQVEGPNELEGGATRWMVSVKAPPLQAPVFKRALVSVTHQVLSEEGFAPDALGRICN